MPKKKTLSDYLGGAKAYATRPGQVGHRDARKPPPGTVPTKAKGGISSPFLEKALQREKRRGGGKRTIGKSGAWF